MYLMIENPGVAPPESFTLLGASTKRGSDNRNLIGKFGSGNKHGIVTLLRHNLAPTVFCGLLRMEFSVRNQRINDGIKGTDFNRVVVKYGGKQLDGTSKTTTEDLGFVVEYGAEDWTETDLALREFVSNSIDRSIEEGELAFVTKMLRDDKSREETRAALFEYRKTARDFEDVRIEFAEQPRAKEGMTRVFIPLDDTVRKFFVNLGKWFLHFSEPESLNKTVLPKAERNLGQSKVAVIYRRGVRVREFESYSMESLFDYNIENLQMDEARKIDDWQAMTEAGKAFARADQDCIERYLRSFDGKSHYWEHDFSSHALSANRSGETPEQTSKINDTWEEAFESVAGRMGVLTTNGNTEMVSRKGYKPVVVPEELFNAAETRGLRTRNKVLSQDDLDGRTIMDATHDAKLAVDYWWSIIGQCKMLNGVEKPTVKSFTAIMDAESQTLGFYRGGVVYLSTDIASPASCTENGNELSKQLLATALEEIAHHITKATDNSRDFQDYAFTLAASLVMKLV